MTALNQITTRRKPRPEVVEAHKARMRAETLAWRLRELREQFDLTQVELARQLDVSQNRLSKIERGDIDRPADDALAVREGVRFRTTAGPVGVA